MQREQASEDNAHRLVADITGAVVAGLKTRVVGIILHGSLASGEYIPGTSDVDLLGVVASPLSGGEKGWFKELAGDVAARWPGPVDLRFVLEAVAAAPPRVPVLEAYAEIRPLACQVGFGVEEPDLVTEFSICRADGISLLGTGPRRIIGEVPDEWVLEVSDAQLASWQRIGDDPPHAELTVLTSCRMWQFAEEGVHGTKQGAAAWALEQNPSLDVVRQALDHRLVGPATVIDPTGVQHLLRIVRSHLAKLISGGSCSREPPLEG